MAPDGNCEQPEQNIMSDMDRSRKRHLTFPSTELDVPVASLSVFSELEHPTPVKVVPNSNSFSFFNPEDFSSNTWFSELSRSDSSNSDLQLTRLIFEWPSPQSIISNLSSSPLPPPNFRNSDARLTPLSVSSAAVGSLVNATATEVIPSRKALPSSAIRYDGDLFWFESCGKLFHVGVPAVCDIEMEHALISSNETISHRQRCAKAARHLWCFHDVPRSSPTPTERKALDAEERMLASG
ncbi:hypothetical protein M427DRAFT_395041 [Gonapodya prolifera JEL478]|uniref:Uncharacterized protein n=1 Tax=Gonapodya prolifera (strain JEL478) TaxID=1344416 RepID=A0A139A6R1_GONPJ|nr:hypothetical protein M427DRAFT_395041 [Gonapodya prolifera JEL478]|eukprot:KXS12520.1 hypothetical protein M427DRAFT_395041 [Gonapodya prolifera JEL478]